MSRWPTSYPGLHRKVDPRSSVTQVLLIGVGIALIAFAEEEGLTPTSRSPRYSAGRRTGRPLLKGLRPGPILSAYANGQTHQPIPVGPLRCPVPGRRARPPVHGAGARARRPARPAGRQYAPVAGQGRRQRGQAAQGPRRLARQAADGAGHARRRACVAGPQSPAQCHRQARPAAQGRLHLERAVRAGLVRGQAHARQTTQGCRRLEGRHREGHRAGARR